MFYNKNNQQEYQTEYQNYLNEVDKINKNNSDVNEHNLKQGKLIASVEIDKKNILEFENSLENYEWLINTKNETNKELNLVIDKLTGK